MSERDEAREQAEEAAPVGSTAVSAADPCADIKDPVRKGLCRVCQVPVVGEAPFCKDHEPPVP